MFEHRIQDHQQFPHAGRQGDLLGLASRTETLIERTATTAAMYNVARIWARPPQTVRFPRHVPLSRFSGATPTNAAICLPVNVL